MVKIKTKTENKDTKQVSSMKKSIGKLISLFLILTSVMILTTCDSWMKNDDFFGIIEEEVKYANAKEVKVFVRYANTKYGTTSIQGTTIQKVDNPFPLTATTSDNYGFYKWAAFSTSDFETGRQHAIIFVDDESYAAEYSDYELPDSVIHFEDEKSPYTNVTINSERNDIFIMPVVAERPTLQASLPAAGVSGVVKNMTLRLVFSKKMDADSLITKDENGNDVLSDNIDILQTYGTFENMSLVSIRNLFGTPTLGVN